MLSSKRVRPDAQVVSERPQELWTGLLVLFVLTAGAYLPSPLYPAYQGWFGLGDLAMTVVYATFALVSAPALLLFGPASDVLGPRPVLRASIAIAAAGSVCFALADGLVWLLGGRAAQGVALGAATGAAGSLISERARGRGGAVLASAAFLAGTAAGPIVGGVLAEYAPRPDVLPYAVHLVLLGWTWRRVSALTAGAASGRRWVPTRPEIPRGMRMLFTTSAASGFLAWAVAGLFLAITPALLTRSVATDRAVIGCILGAVLVCSVATQPVVARFGSRWAQLVGLGALSISLGLLALSAGGSIPVTLVAAVLAGAGHGLAYGGASAAIEAAAPPDKRGAITGALYLAFYLGAGCPAVAIGLMTLVDTLATATSRATAVAAGLVVPVGVAVARTVPRASATCTDQGGIGPRAAGRMPSSATRRRRAARTAPGRTATAPPVGERCGAPTRRARPHRNTRRPRGCRGG